MRHLYINSPSSSPAFSLSLNNISRQKKIVLNFLFGCIFGTYAAFYRNKLMEIELKTPFIYFGVVIITKYLMDICICEDKTVEYKIVFRN